MPFGYRTAAASDSPWDREYGTATDKVFIPPGRSAMDPAFPPMDPRTFHPLSADHQNVLDIHHPNPIDKPSPPELDALFYSESSQMMDFHGLRTFEAAALHNPAWSQNRLDEVNVPVNENRWLNVFKKIRWCSFERPIIETSPGLAAAGFGMADDWSVDNPAVWGPLSTSIELANRIILQSFKTPWMQALLTPENWATEYRDTQDARRQFPVIPNTPVPVFFPDPNRPDKTEEQCKQYFQGLFATQKPLWHLHADTDDRSRVWMGFAATNRRADLASDSGFGHFINHLAAFVDVDPLRTMLSPNATSHSRYIARAMLAITISHELMHILLLQIFKLRGWLSRGEQIFFNGERMAELGHSFIQNFFGNAVENVPLRLGRYMSLRGPVAGSGPFFNAYSTFFPESHISLNSFSAIVHVVPDQPADPLAYRKDTKWDVAAANLMTANFQNDMQTASADLSLPLDAAFFAQLSSHKAQLVAVQQYLASHPGAPQPLIPFTFQLYDLRVQEDDVLVLVFFDSEIEIFKLEDVMQVLMMTAEEVRDEMEPSAYGHVLQKNFSDEFYAAEHGILPLGRVAQWLREEDVAIRDGKEGRPHWITAAGFVYDLTDLEELASESQSNLVETLMSAPGSNPIPRVFLGDHDFDEALALIEPLKIGMTLPFGLADESGSKDVLTDHEIGWNQFPQTRQYIQIHEHVYDITDYADWHPGGTSILTHAAGTNATTLFEEYHSENGEDLLEAIQGLRVGRMVSSRTRSEKLSTTEICIQDTIFDIAPLQATEAELFVALKPYCGRDTSKKVLALEPSIEPSETHPLLLLCNSKPELIVAKIQHGMEDLPAMNEAELATHDGETFDSLISERVHKMINSGNYCNNIFRFELSPDWSSMTRPLEQWLQKQVGGKPIETGH
ncbi:putative cytochrome b5 like protein [Verticillium longisporum]|nr:putative cytochrome b5 like protein [Verticillium longisporum]